MKKRLSPITINNKKSGNTHISNLMITPKHENSIILYLNEISNKNCDPILKLSEKELFDAYQEGEKMIELLENKDNIRPEESVYNIIRRGNQAKEILIKSNLRFVVSVAKHYQNQGLPFEDLVSEGNLGLLKSLKKFDSTKNIKFLSYAVWWIRQSILHSLVENGKMIRIPTNKRDSLIKVKRYITKLEQELHRKPTTEEIVDSMSDLGLNLSVEDINTILMTNRTQLSLDSPLINSGSETKIIDLIESDEDYDHNKDKDIKDGIDKILSKLDTQERNIIEMYYGVLCDRKYTLEEISEKFTLTRERIRQIKEKAIRKLRNKHNPKIINTFDFSVSQTKPMVSKTFDLYY